MTKALKFGLPAGLALALFSSAAFAAEGAVADRRMKRDAEDLVEQVPGVTQVHNHLRIDTARINGAVDANGHAVQ